MEVNIIHSGEEAGVEFLSMDRVLIKEKTLLLDQAMVEEVDTSHQVNDKVLKGLSLRK